MSETTNVRLVRCAKCENLLPEVTGYSVYRCGGCGAVLRAGDKCVDLDSFSEKSDEEKVAITKEKYFEKYERNNMSAKRMIGKGDGIVSVSSSRGAEGRAIEDSAEYYSTGLMDKENKWENGDERENKGQNLDELRGANVARDFEYLSLCNDDETRLRRLDQVANGRNGGRSEIGGFRRAQMVGGEGMRYLNSNFSGEPGSPDLASRRSHDCEFQVKNRIDVDGFSRDGYIRDEGFENLRMLDGRKEWLSRYGDLDDKGKEKTFLDRSIVHDDSLSRSETLYPNKTVGANSSSGQYSYLDTRFNRPPSYQDQYPEPSSLMYRLETGGDDFNPSRYAYASSHVRENEAPLRPQTLRRESSQKPPSYQQSSSHPYASGSYRGDGMGYVDPLDPYRRNVNCHHPSCSCFYCSNKRHVPHPAAFRDNFSDVAVDTMSNFHENRGSFSPQYNFQATNHRPLRSHNPLSHMRWPSDMSSEMDGFIRRRLPSDTNSEVDGFIPQRPPRVHSVSVGGHWRPIGGGAPFLTCLNCFELLLLPKNVATTSNSRKKIKCGVCSIVIVFAFSNKKLVVYDNEESSTDNPVKLDYNSNLSPTREHLNQDRTTFSSDDYDNSGYDFESLDRVEKSTPRRGRVDDSSETNHQNSKSVPATEVEKVTKHLNVRSEDSKFAYQEPEDEEPPPPAGSSLQEYFEYSNKFHVKNRTGAHEKCLPIKITKQQSSINDLSAATETDLSSNEFSNTGTSFDSGEASRKGRRSSESFFAGIVKKSFKEFNRSNRNAEKENDEVSINGRLMPDDIIKKAEEVAGPIRPGQYWYDYQAGFWGVMGGPCVGIIPPFIEEFNHPMPEKCAGGNTGIYVNGRELNQKDLSLLKRRGLPTTRNRSYIIETSGRVTDEDSGEELRSLGKLAPTMERFQRGFGMRVPRTVPRA